MADHGVTVESMGIGGWFGDTAEGGASAICQTICSPCMLLVAIILVFYGEYNYVKDLNNIYEINNDMVDAVTAYETANDGKPVAFYAAWPSIVTGNITDSTFKMEIDDVIAVVRKAYMLVAAPTERKENNNKITDCTKNRWSSSTGTQGNKEACGGVYNNIPFRSPCSTSLGSSCDADLYGSFTAGGYTVDQNFLMDDYTTRTTATVGMLSSFKGNWKTQSWMTNPTTKWFDCGSFLANNGRTNTQAATCSSNGYTGSSGQRYDQSVTWETYPAPTGGLTICSKQAANGGFEALKSNGNYDVMIEGKKSKADCIKIMEDEATATVYAFRIIGFILFWVAFCMLFSIVSFLADRVGQLIPCGIGQAFEDTIQCLIAIVTCPPACACWLLWFALAWLVFRPLIGGIVFAVALILFCGMYYLWSQSQEPEKDVETDGKIEQTQIEANYNTQPIQSQPVQQPMQQQQQPAQNGGYMNNMVNQAQNWMNATPWGPNQQPAQAPPQMNMGMQDLNGDGIPDQYQTNLPPNFVACIDQTSNRVYWVNYNTNPPTSQWNDPRVVPPPVTHLNQ